jgi:hypothetical protein
MHYMNAQKERVSDSENFGERIIEFGVAVANIWRKEVIGSYLSFLEVARGISRNIFETQGFVYKKCGLRLNYGQV